MRPDWVFPQNNCGKIAVFSRTSALQSLPWVPKPAGCRAVSTWPAISAPGRCFCSDPGRPARPPGSGNASRMRRGSTCCTAKCFAALAGPRQAPRSAGRGRSATRPTDHRRDPEAPESARRRPRPDGERLASDAAVPARTVREYFQGLEDTLLATLLRPFRPGGARRKPVSHAMLHFFDVGVANVACIAWPELRVPTSHSPLIPC